MLRGLSWRVEERMEVALDRKQVDVPKGSRAMAAGLPHCLRRVQVYMLDLSFADLKSNGQHKRQTHPAGGRGNWPQPCRGALQTKGFPGHRWWLHVCPCLQQAEDPSWGQTGSFLWPEHSLPFGVEISITKILPPRPTHTDCWQARCFIDAHMLTGYFLVLRTRKSSGPFLLVSMLIL